MRFHNIFAAGIFCGVLTITGCGRNTQAVNAASDGATVAAKEATSGICTGGQQPQGLQASAGQPSSPGQPNAPGQPYVQDGYYSILHRPVLIVDQPTAAVYTPQPEPLYETPPPAVRSATRATVRSDRGRHHGRSKGKSAAIVGGSAAAGAGIGAIAGGGKGAAIGAISGGGAGFIYDRLTHNHR